MMLQDYVQQVLMGMGTVITCSVFGPRAEAAAAAARVEVERLEGLLSRFIETSDIAQINRSAGMSWVKVSDEVLALLKRAVRYSVISEGLFDVTIAPLVELWLKGMTEHVKPNQEEIVQLLSNIDYRDLLFDESAMEVMLRRNAQGIDLGGIGKGYASDRVLQVYREHGVQSAYANFGGNVATLGVKPDGSPWQVGIRHPRRPNEIIGVVSVVNKSVVTSGDDQRYYIDDAGDRQHHLLDPRVGYPAASGLSSVTIIGDSGEQADALSTMVFIAGLERGMEILKVFDGTEGVLIDQKQGVFVTNGIIDSFAPQRHTRVHRI